jgi:uncharacterized protein (TIGR02145 family)
LDVRQTYVPGSACLPLASRTNDFDNENYSFTYTFTGSGTDLTYVYADGSGIVSSVVGSGNTCTLTFNSNVITQATGRSKDNALKVTLYALFKVSGVWSKVSLEISIQDCFCGCPAKINDGKWLTFQCHNLGGEDIYPGMIIERKHHGDWYRFGSKNPSRTNTADHDGTGWDNTYYQTGSEPWRPDNDPCPPGYRLPTKDEWTQVAANNYMSNVGSFISTTSFMHNFTAGNKFGDFLVLPVAGYRTDAGKLDMRATNGIYWSNNETDLGGNLWMSFGTTNTSAPRNRDQGLSVRCFVSAERYIRLLI